MASHIVLNFERKSFLVKNYGLPGEIYRRKLYNEFIGKITSLVRTILKSDLSKFDIYKIKIYISQFYMRVISRICYEQKTEDIIKLNDPLLCPCNKEDAEYLLNCFKTYFSKFKDSSFLNLESSNWEQLLDKIVDESKIISEKIHIPFSKLYSLDSSLDSSLDTSLNSSLDLNDGSLDLNLNDSFNMEIYDTIVKFWYENLYLELPVLVYERMKFKFEISDKQIFQILLRYDTLNSGANQFSVDLNRKSRLQAKGIDFELFASPLNVFMSSYCSLFPDIDPESYGPFTAYESIKKNFMANPPYVDFLLEKMCETANKGEGFDMCIISLPLWDDFPLISFMDKSTHLLARRIISEEFINDLSQEKVPIPPYISYLLIHPQLNFDKTEIVELFEERPIPKIKDLDGIKIIDDSILLAGTKARAMYEFLILILFKRYGKKHPPTTIFMSAAPSGLGMVALVDAVKRIPNLSCIIYTQDTKGKMFPPVEYCKKQSVAKVKILSGSYRDIYGILERDLATHLKYKKAGFEVRLGGEDPDFIEILGFKLKTVFSLLDINDNIHLYLANGTSALYKALSLAKPNIKYHLVVVGKKLHDKRPDDEEIKCSMTMYQDVPNAEALIKDLKTIVSYDAKALFYAKKALHLRNHHLSSHLNEKKDEKEECDIYMWNVGSYEKL